MAVNASTREAINLAKKGDYKEALKAFDTDKSYAEDGLALSYYALSLAAVKKDYNTAIKACVAAAKIDHFNVHIYLNAGKVYLLAGKKEQAIKTLQKGLRIDPTNQHILKQLKTLGSRQKPFFPFLSRGSVLNVVAGKIAHSLKSKKGSADEKKK